MPNWKTHLEVAKRLNNKLKLKDNEYIEFLFGNILPDINNAFIVSDISNKISHNITHFNKDTYKGYSDFYDEYKDYMNNKVVLGYYTHLYTDYIFNNDFSTKSSTFLISIILSPKLLLKSLKSFCFRILNFSL